MSIPVYFPIVEYQSTPSHEREHLTFLTTERTKEKKGLRVFVHLEGTPLTCREVSSVTALSSELNRTRCKGTNNKV